MSPTMVPFDCTCGYSVNLPESNVHRLILLLEQSHSEARPGHGRCNREDNREAHRLRSFRNGFLYHRVNQDLQPGEEARRRRRIQEQTPIDYWAEIQKDDPEPLRFAHGYGRRRYRIGGRVMPYPPAE